ncbi:MAG: helix-turn-helix transcriptional regulator [Pseudomonadota bacterium]
MPTPSQIRAARGLLNWSQKDLAERAGVTEATVRNTEKDGATPNSKTLDKITRALDSNIDFMEGDGLRRKEQRIRRYKGTQGFRDFMDDVYETAKNHGGEICLHNSRPRIWYKWLGEDWYQMHAKRMADLGNKISVKITVQQGDDFFILGAAQHRWFPKDAWKGKIFYAYGPKLGFISEEGNSIQVLVLDQPEFTESFRILFNIAWDNVAIVPKNTTD